MLKKSIVVIALSLNLAACGGGDPIAGKVEGNGQQVALISANGAVYKIDNSKFENWKATISKDEQLPDSKAGLLALRDKYASVELVQQQFSDSDFLSKPELDFENYVKDIDETGGKFVAEINETIQKSQQYLDSVATQKGRSDEAKAELDKKKQALSSQLQALDEAFSQSRAKAATYFIKYDKKEFRVSNELVKEASRETRYGNKSDDKPIEDCREFVTSSTWLFRDEAKTNVYGEQYEHEGRHYCPYFQMPGYTPDEKAKLKAKLPQAAIDELRNASGAYIRQLKSSPQIKKDLARVDRDNPQLVEQVNSFGWRERQRYNRAENNIRYAEDEKKRLLAMPAKLIEADSLKLLSEELEKAKPIYELGMFYDAMEKASDIQPDGTFTVKTDANYLLVIDLMDKPNPRSTQVAVMRVSDDDEQIVTVTTDDFIRYSSVPQLSFQ
ncbi:MULTISPECIES: hypothetical protein [Salinimonas]|uniref:Lipoprotein n=2 Tax=Salinimonas TaxID=288793 RepID=A0A5B7YHX2_9ALTE|nr:MULTISPECIES: hypothetical protein [Salinimonas]MBD3587655.1 hypothetical protein [Salinimonas profundi]QCZ95432.1 hypothetical protein FBQ74_18015 [Salinimonas iocasae]